MLYWFCNIVQESPQCNNVTLPTGTQIKHAIMRNFGGMNDDRVTPLNIFLKKLSGTIGIDVDLTLIPTRVSAIIPDFKKYYVNNYRTLQSYCTL